MTYDEAHEKLNAMDVHPIVRRTVLRRLMLRSSLPLEDYELMDVRLEGDSLVVDERVRFRKARDVELK